MLNNNVNQSMSSKIKRSFGAGHLVSRPIKGYGLSQCQSSRLEC